MTIESVSQITSALIRYVLEPSIRSCALVLVVSFLLFAVRLRDIPARLAIWKLVLLAALTMPLLAGLVPALSIPLRPLSNTTGVLLPPPASTLLAAAEGIADNSGPLRAREAPASHQDYSTWRSIDWESVATFLYIFVAAIMLARLVVGLALSRRLQRKSRPIGDQQALDVLKEVTPGRITVVNLAESQAVTVPIALSLGRSTILLPIDWRAWEPQKLRAVLAHEMAHVSSRDALVQMLSALHRCFFWFSPASWWLHRRIGEMTERAADDRAVEVVSDRVYYAEVLLGFFEALKSNPGRVRGNEVSMARGSAAERRLDGVLSERRVLSVGIRRAILVGALLVMFPIVYIAAALGPLNPGPNPSVLDQPVAPLQHYRPTPETDLALQIGLPKPFNARTVRVSFGRTMTTVSRDQLPVVDSARATGITGLDVWADREGEAIRLRLAVLYNDLSNPEWWKDKQEKVLDSVVIASGDSLRASELAEFGIEPVEFRAMKAELIVFHPGEGPKIINKTRALEVTKLEKSLDSYYVSLRNVSDKNIISFSFLNAVEFRSFGGAGSLLPAGGDCYRLDLPARSVDAHGITIAHVVFEDRTFEGDASRAQWFLAEDEGVRLAIPAMLGLVEEALRTEDENLEGAVNKLVSQLQTLQEPAVPTESFESFRARFSAVEDKMQLPLYNGHLGAGFAIIRSDVLFWVLSLKKEIDGVTNDPGPNQLDANWKGRRIRGALVHEKELLEQVATRQ